MNVLDDIIAGVLEDLAARQQDIPLAELARSAAAAPPALDAFAALGGGSVPHAESDTVRVIAEVKRRSPSKGELADIADPAALATLYSDGGAAVISVLTEARRFGGSLADFDAVRRSVSVPMLRKDFMVREYQIFESRAHGADVILLIVAALSDAQLRQFLDLTHRLGMEALVETHTAEEVRRAVALGARIIGINVRNLKTLAVDRRVFVELSGAIPPGTVIVAESGVRNVDDVALYAAQGADAVLVGEALVSHRDPKAVLQAFSAVGRTARQSHSS